MALTPPRDSAAAPDSPPDRAARHMSLFYLSYFGGMGMYAPYLVLFLQAHHVSPVGMGIPVTLGPALGARRSGPVARGPSPSCARSSR